jgi:hypothetical protein
MNWDVRQTKWFAHIYKKLHNNNAVVGDAAIKEIVNDPDIGAKKAATLLNYGSISSNVSDSSIFLVTPATKAFSLSILRP